MTRVRRSGLSLLAVLALPALMAGCGTDGAQPEAAPARASPGQRFPDVTAARLTRLAGDGYRLDVTISSPYDTPRRYADGWRVLTPGGRVLGRHRLGHDHADEQPFTRTQDGLHIPTGTRRVSVQGRDRTNGYGGKTVTIAVP